MRFLDTNILLYSISQARGEEKKRSIAEALLLHDDCVLSVQVLQEFYVQATRPSRPDALSHENAAAFMGSWMRFRIQDVTVPILRRALLLKQRYGFSYWDCSVVAAACATGCDALYSEDLGHGQVIEGVRIVNPFI
ncbi:MAG TPA: PIN domain-containing protein [Rhizomicrobium sp.]|nr:PIN domain-containing protein [Rhizomicrobium sp.]